MDWESFFNDHHIDYVTRGSNVKRGNVNIACPLCGDDPSHHMGVSLEGKGWGCWRSANHAGKKPQNLIRALLGCSYNQAKLITQQYSQADPESLSEALEALQARDRPDKRPDKRGKLKMPAEFRDVTKSGSTARFYNYLKRRGYKRPMELCELYNLKCATTGKWKDRIIIPIYMDGELVSWTSRAIIKPVNAPRYLALSEDQGGLINVFDALYNWDELKEGGDLLLVVEGPFDAINVDYRLLDIEDNVKVGVTCTFGTSMSDEQAFMIASVVKKFRKGVLLYDTGATEAIFRAKELLSHTKMECGFLPDDVDDPGDMSSSQVSALIRQYI